MLWLIGRLTRELVADWMALLERSWYQHGGATKIGVRDNKRKQRCVEPKPNSGRNLGASLFAHLFQEVKSADSGRRASKSREVHDIPLRPALKLQRRYANILGSAPTATLSLLLHSPCWIAGRHGSWRSVVSLSLTSSSLHRFMRPLWLECYCGWMERPEMAAAAAANTLVAFRRGCHCHCCHAVHLSVRRINK